MFMSNRHTPNYFLFLFGGQWILTWIKTYFLFTKSWLLSALVSESHEQKNEKKKKILQKHWWWNIDSAMFLSLKSQLLLAEICRNIPLEKIKGTWKGVARCPMPMPWVVVDSKPVSAFDANSLHSRIFVLDIICTQKYLRSRKFSLKKICSPEYLFWRQFALRKKLHSRKFALEKTTQSLFQTLMATLCNW